jgi:hypothetical protein
MTNQRMAQLLGYAGLIPFFASAVTVIVGGVAGVSADAARNAGITYGAIIVTFMGALHWAYALVAPWKDERVTPQVLFASVLPAMVAWGTLVFAPSARFAAITIAAALLWVFSKDAVFQREAWFPKWFWRLRTHLTAGAVFSVFVFAFA